jgi:hypothetical protein
VWAQRHTVPNGGLGEKGPPTNRDKARDRAAQGRHSGDGREGTRPHPHRTQACARHGSSVGAGLGDNTRIAAGRGGRRVVQAPGQPPPNSIVPEVTRTPRRVPPPTPRTHQLGDLPLTGVRLLLCLPREGVQGVAGPWSPPVLCRKQRPLVCHVPFPKPRNSGLQADGLLDACPGETTLRPTKGLEGSRSLDPAAMDAGTLVSEAVRVIKTFNPAVSTMDSHVLDSLGVFNDVRAWGGPFPCPLPWRAVRAQW